MVEICAILITLNFRTSKRTLTCHSLGRWPCYSKNVQNILILHIGLTFLLSRTWHDILTYYSRQWNKYLHWHSSPSDISRVSCQKCPTRHAYAWQIGPFWQDTLDILIHLLGRVTCSLRIYVSAYYVIMVSDKLFGAVTSVIGRFPAQKPSNLMLRRLLCFQTA